MTIMGVFIGKTLGESKERSNTQGIHQKDTAYLTYALQGQTLLRIMSKLDALESEFQTCACKRIRKSQHKEPSHTDFVIELNWKTFIWCFWFSTIQYFQEEHKKCRKIMN